MRLTAYADGTVTRWLIAVVCLILLSACVSPGMVTPSARTDFKRRMAELQEITSWQVEGRLAFSDGKRGATLRVLWAQAGAASSVRLSAPMGQGSWCLWVDSHGAVLRDPEGSVRRDSSAALLLHRWLGWYAPISLLPEWLRAVPNGPERVVFGRDGLPEEISTAQWTVHYAKYRMVGGVWVPGRVKLIRGNYRLNLLLRKWTLWRNAKRTHPPSCSVAGL